MTTIQHFIGGRWTDSADGRTFETRDPHDGSLLANVARGGAVDGEAAILHRLADKVDENRDELAMLETRDGGKAISQTSHADIPRVATNLRFFADYVAMAGNEAYPDGDLFSYVLYPAAGVVAAISPWNAPLMLATWKIAPALAFGNTVVLKPAPQTPLTAARFAELAVEAGMPEGVLNVVHGFGGDEVAGPLTSDPRVDRITFTGSSATGVKILQSAAVNHTPVSAEMGGKSANIIFADADLDIAVPKALRAIFVGNGQVCLSGTRLLVQNSIRDEFLDRFVSEAAKLKVGDPKDPETFVGPLITDDHLSKVSGYVDLAREEGGEIVLGGSRLTSDEHAAGFYYPPTIITGLTNQDRVAREEIFGPVETVIGFDTEDEAMRIANDSPYGLAGMLFTTNLDRAHRMAANWKAGTVWINTFFERDLRLPFGGEGISGLGREGGQFSRDFFTEPRAVTIRLNPESR